MYNKMRYCLIQTRLGVDQKQNAYTLKRILDLIEDVQDGTAYIKFISNVQFLL